MTAPVPGTRVCDHTSVGVLIAEARGLLLFERATPPVGIAPVAGHVDDHGDAEQAARNEVREELGLTVTSVHLLIEQWRPNHCRRTSADPAGHQWSVFQARFSGELRPSAREVRAPRWVPMDQVQQLAMRTAALADGRLNETTFRQAPGIEPVWCGFLQTLDVITVPKPALARIEALL